MNDDERAISTKGEGSGIDEQRRRILKLTLGGSAAFAAPLMLSYSLEGLALGPAQVAASNCSNQSITGGTAKAALDSSGNLLITVALVNCASTAVLITATADVEVVYGCRNRGGEFPPGQNQSPAVVTDTVSNSIEITPETDSPSEHTLTLTPPEAPQGICPPGLEPAVREITYTNISAEVSIDVAFDQLDVSPIELSVTF